jgi:hypothetical protein
MRACGFVEQPFRTVVLIVAGRVVLRARSCGLLKEQREVVVVGRYVAVLFRLVKSALLSDPPPGSDCSSM